MSNAALLAYWIENRELMRVRRTAVEAGTVKMDWKHGYHDDPHMGAVRYCNVRREDDKVTVWLRQNWREPDLTPGQWAVARMVNYIPSLEAIKRDAMVNEWDGVASVLKSRRAAGHKIWTGAYTISTAGNPMDKVDYVMDVVRNADRRKWNFEGLRLATAHSIITQVSGLGSFLAAQLIADMKNTPLHPLYCAQDWVEWAAHGPGSLRGLSAYFGRTITPGKFANALQACWNEVRPLLAESVQDLHMQDFQNCMCEFSKYMRRRGGGHVRNTYNPG